MAMILFSKVVLLRISLFCSQLVPATAPPPPIVLSMHPLLYHIHLFVSSLLTALLFTWLVPIYPSCLSLNVTPLGDISLTLQATSGLIFYRDPDMFHFSPSESLDLGLSPVIPKATFTSTITCWQSWTEHHILGILHTDSWFTQIACLQHQNNPARRGGWIIYESWTIDKSLIWQSNFHFRRLYFFNYYFTGGHR